MNSENVKNLIIHVKINKHSISLAYKFSLIFNKWYDGLAHLKVGLWNASFTSHPG